MSQITEGNFNFHFRFSGIIRDNDIAILFSIYPALFTNPKFDKKLMPLALGWRKLFLVRGI
jgi:hypothetical protein